MTERYRDASLPTELRVKDLVDRMTLDEKLAQLASRYIHEILVDSDGSPTLAEELLADGVGHISRIGGAAALSPETVVEVANALQRHLTTKTRLGIPAIVHEECVAGYMGPGGTNYPHSIGIAATFDPRIPERIGTAVSRQLREAGAHQGLAPVLDVCRDPRWGRVEETSGEDPYLVGAMGLAAVRGLQGGDPATAVVATAKHFAGHGVPEGGLNAAPPHMGPRELREVFLTPFEAAVRIGGVSSFMHAYHEIDGVPCIAHGELLDRTLREAWRFDGTLVSDYNGIEELAYTHRLVPDLVAAATVAIENGVDVELPSTAAYGDPLRHAVETGQVDQSHIDRSVARVLTQKFELGLFEDPYVDARGMRPTDDDRAIALDAARRSIVLLENSDDILPLTGHRTIGVIGPSAHDARLHLGDYSYAAALELLNEIHRAGMAFMGSIDGPVPPVDLSDVPTVLDAIRDRAAADVSVVFEPGCESVLAPADTAAAVRVAEASDVVVFVGGDRSGMDDMATCGEFRDRSELGLPGEQQTLLDAVVDTGTPVVLVLLGGRPLAPDLRGVSAVLHAWLPGDAGGPAIADVLFGIVSPGGKLPMTVPRHSGQIPIYHGHKPTGGRSRLKGPYVDRSNTPLWPFGHGLSYTSFELSALRVAERTVSTDGVVECEVDVVNSGRVEGDEVVQLYARRDAASVTRPVRELVGFSRVSLAPGERATVRFSVPVDLFGFVGPDMSFGVEPGTVHLAAATSSDVPTDAWLDVELTGPRRIEPDRSFFSSVEVS